MPVVQLETSMGNITLELHKKDAPNSVEKFLDYVNSGFYNDTMFHRVIDDFIIQGGGFDGGMNEKSTKDPIKNEATNGLINTVGTVAMARSSDPHSATSQFFINTVDNDFLDHTGKNPIGWGYAVFGQVTDGMDVVYQIQGVETHNKAHHQDVPVETVMLITATVISE